MRLDMVGHNFGIEEVGGLLDVGIYLGNCYWES
jgi:hypothetical protein